MSRGGSQARPAASNAPETNGPAGNLRSECLTLSWHVDIALARTQRPRYSRPDPRQSHHAIHGAYLARAAESSLQISALGTQSNPGRSETTSTPHRSHAVRRAVNPQTMHDDRRH